MTETIAEAPEHETWHLVVGLAIIVLIVGAGIALFTVLSPTSADLRRCDHAIKATLKAPATFKRVSADGSFDGGGPRLYMITYDAENSFGVPLRASGFCSFDGAQDTPRWLENPAPLS